MRSLLTLLLLLAAPTCGLAGRELLREILHPKADLPSFRLLLPADWTNEVDAAGNLLAANADRTANFALSFARASAPHEALDGLAKAILTGAVVAPWDSREPVEVSGHRGYKYTARVRHANGVQVRAEVILVAAGERHIAACSLLLGDRISRSDETLARLVHASVKLLPPP